MPSPFAGMTHRPGTDPAWTARALCRGIDPKLFCGTDLETHAFRMEREREAKKICTLCPVREPCLDYAVRYNMRGVWGGTTDEERIMIRTGRRPRRYRP